MKPKRAQRSFAFFYKERKRTQRTPRSFIKTLKNAKNVPFFYKEGKRMQRMFRSFIMNGKEHKERCVLL